MEDGEEGVVRAAFIAGAKVVGARGCATVAVTWAVENVWVAPGEEGGGVRWCDKGGRSCGWGARWWLMAA